MNDSHKTSSKAIALFMSLGMLSSLAACGIGGTEGEGGEDGNTIEEPTYNQEDEGDEGGEDDNTIEEPTYNQEDEGGEGGEGGDD